MGKNDARCILILNPVKRFIAFNILTVNILPSTICLQLSFTNEIKYNLIYEKKEMEEECIGEGVCRGGGFEGRALEERREGKPQPGCKIIEKSWKCEKAWGF